eukprot:scaffold119837_cov69-Phaeocystis_antarctica.AAC.2
MASLLTWRPPPGQEPRHRHAAAGGLAWRRALLGQHSGSAASGPVGVRGGVRRGRGRATRHRAPQTETEGVSSSSGRRTVAGQSGLRGCIERSKGVYR